MMFFCCHHYTWVFFVLMFDLQIAGTCESPTKQQTQRKPQKTINTKKTKQQQYNKHKENKTTNTHKENNKKTTNTNKTTVEHTQRKQHIYLNNCITVSAFCMYSTHLYYDIMYCATIKNWFYIKKVQW